MKLKNFYSRLFKSSSAAPSAEHPAPPVDPPAPPHLSETVVFGKPGEDSSIYFIDEARGIRKMLVDPQGRFQNFPGFVKEDCWINSVPSRVVEPQIRFRTSFDKWNDGWMVHWEIWPDGRYWADDGGFGMEDDAEVALYTFVDGNGDFTGPFRVYCVGNRGFAIERFESMQRHGYDSVLEELRGGESKYRWTHCAFFPPIRGANRHFHYDDYHEEYYELWDAEEAAAFWRSPALSRNMVQLSEALMERPEPARVWYQLQDRLWSCMTLFYLVTGEEIFKRVLDRYFQGRLEEFTANRLNSRKP